MIVRSPTAILIVDANIILRAVMGRSFGQLLPAATDRRTIRTTHRAMREIYGVMRGRGLADALHVAALARTMTFVTVEPAAAYEALEEKAANVLCEAPQSRNGSTNDAHILALAWALDADIWSHDRDFAGTGWPSWSSANLAAALAAEAA